MKNLANILEKMYEEIENKEMFLPLVLANAIIGYKLAHDNEIYWCDFSKKSQGYSMRNLQDIYMFFIDFLPQTSQFQESYQRKIDHLKKFDNFLKEFSIKQKYYFKNPDSFKKDLDKALVHIPNYNVGSFCVEINRISSEIRFIEK